MNLLRYTLLLPVLAALAYTSACSGPTGKELDTPTSGQITLAVDASFKPIIASTIATFEDAYPAAKIKPVYTSEGAAFNMLMQDSARMVVASRGLSAQEAAYFAKRQITPHQYPYAVDAVAVVLHRANPDTLLTLDQLKGIVSGQTKTWPGRAEAVQPVADAGSSANLEYLKTRLGVAELPPTLYATGSNESVIDYVAAHPGAIGFIGVGTVADTESPAAQGFVRKIRVASIADAAIARDSNSYQPYQAYLQLKKYPLARTVYIVSREARAGLGTGFAAWALSDKGQRIILKAGLLPKAMPVRIINLGK